MKYLTKRNNIRCGETGFIFYIFLLILFSSSSVHASSDQHTNISAGATLNINFEAYNPDVQDPKLSIMPTIFYDNSLLYIESDEVGAYLYQDEKNQLRINTYYDSSSYDPDDHDRHLNKRKWSVMAGASYMRITPYGGFKLQIGSDILNRNKGTVITAAYLAELQQGRWTWYPEFGINWNNSSYNQYYYGVTHVEAQKTHLAVYQAKSAFEPYISINSTYRLNHKFDITSGIEINYMSNELYSSPLVNKRFDITAIIGFLYHF
ncbi:MULTISPECIES: MipA/OmpV family protein [unclassified Acinetobacter]|uniref:MipA/OmpV family protein n=1 Tax=unclassified Acinetobacter TaxID=196816 RepID=UPI0029346691|nr:MULTISPECIES: MipA/OmpV family protein [unclassified Acinetobacter]WOE31855.1 MipA/OmpV family protein [Acinetobacter sp. SAAs470]WOE37322.1 MipA/OmpV family protein [Acinetobacter sp. SAAs474]